MSLSYGLYGTPPSALVDLPSDAVQFSPLMPGASHLEECSPQSLDMLTVLAPPGTLERRYVLALALRALKSGATLVALAPKDKGGARLAKELTAFGCQPSETSRQHHRICTVAVPTQLAGLELALVEGGPQLVQPLGLWTQPGVFSWNRADPGSVLLAENLPVLAGIGADLGCGLGLLSNEVLGSSRVAALTLVDLDRRAIEAARRNCTDPRASFIWADIGDANLGKGLDFVVTNPPFHDGGQEDRSLGQRFISRAAAALRNGGQLWLVANRHLPYEQTLNGAFSQVEMLADNGGYKIFRATK